MRQRAIPFCICTLLLAAQSDSAPQRKQLSLTLFASDLAFVQDQRRLDLPGGASRLDLEGVAETLVPTSLNLRSLDPAHPFEVLAQSYQSQTLDPKRLLERYIDQPVKVATLRTGAHGTEEVIEDAILRSKEGSPILQFKDRVEVSSDYPRRILLPSIPTELKGRPGLRAELSSSQSGPMEAELSYLARGLGWEASYQVLLDPKTDKARITASAVLKNDTDTTFPDARLRLSSASLERSMTWGYSAKAAENSYNLTDRALTVDMGGKARQPSETALAGQRLFAIDHPITLLAHQTTEVKLFDAAAAPFLRTQVVQLDLSSDVETDKDDDAVALDVETRLEFLNVAESGLGRWFPEGSVAILQADAEGQENLLNLEQGKPALPGERMFLHLPVTELRARLRCTARKALPALKPFKRITENRYEVKLNNQSSKEATFRVEVACGEAWEVLESSAPTKPSGVGGFQADVKVPAGNILPFTFKVRLRSRKGKDD